MAKYLNKLRGKILKNSNKMENINTEKEAKHEHEDVVDTGKDVTEPIPAPETKADSNPTHDAKIAELNDKYLRLYSEFDNFKKRTARERIELIQTAGKDIFVSLLPILDDFERGIKATKDAKDIEAVKEGLYLIHQKLKTSLQQKGLEEMKSIGEEFNSDIQEAITSTPAPSEDMKGKVVDEMEKGYYLNGKVIRFAKVIIGS